MPKPKSVNIAGTEIKEVLGVNITINTPFGPRGDYEGRTYAATVRLLRRATNTPTVEMFKLATNDDGRLNIINGEIVLENHKTKQPTYTITLEEAYISQWSFSQPDSDNKLDEVIILQVGKMQLSGGGGNKSFLVPEFNQTI